MRSTTACSLALAILVALASVLTPEAARAAASNNIPLDSPVYTYLEKLASFGLITSDFKGIRPISKAEAARLLVEAEMNRSDGKESAQPYTGNDYILTIKHYPPFPTNRWEAFLPMRCLQNCGTCWGGRSSCMRNRKMLHCSMPGPFPNSGCATST